MDYYASYSTYRTLATRLAESGLACLRFDYRATGDSAGYPADLSDPSIWLDDIQEAVEFLLERGARTVTTVGMRFGATLAARHASTNTGHGGLVLWDPCLDGRSFLRQSTLLLRQSAEITGVPLPDDQDRPSALTGYDFAQQFGAGLAQLRVEHGSRPTGRTLILTRDGTLPRALGGWADLERVTVAVADGQPSLLEVPLEEVRVPNGSVETIVSWCRAAAHEPLRLARPELSATTRLLSRSGEPVDERIWHEDGLFGIQSGPGRDEADFAVLCNTGGAQPRNGTNRLWVELGRELAVRGIRSLRFDLPDVGDSDPDGPDQPDRVFAPGALSALETARQQVATSQTPTVAVGLCSGGYHALEAAAGGGLVGVYAVHPTFEFGRHSGKAHLDHPRRRVWVADRPWIARLDRHRVTSTLKWRAPAWVWKTLRWTGWQSDITEGVFRIVALGTETVLIVESHRLDGPRMRRVRDSKTPGLTVVRSTADHSLIDFSARQAVAADIQAWTEQIRQHRSQAVVP
jgi:alpha-beta hydrolase superfamily lysophospholipase